MGIDDGLTQHPEQKVLWDSTLKTATCLNRLKEVRYAIEMIPNGIQNLKVCTSGSKTFLCVKITWSTF